MVIFCCYSQQNILTCGLDIPASSENFSVSFSVAQIFTHTFSHDSYTIENGLQHNLSATSLLDPQNDSYLDVGIFPIPTSNLLFIYFNKPINADLKFSIYNIMGTQLHSRSIRTQKSSIALGDFLPGFYILKICKSSADFKTVKIQLIKDISYEN